ncbi:hypothetical protein BC826DRAFT_1018636 [Russula brevipes]|nr:hypothetical protein BC826DRAFT_1018636 [Russula brevipes]
MPAGFLLCHFAVATRLFPFILETLLGNFLRLSYEITPTSMSQHYRLVQRYTSSNDAQDDDLHNGTSLQSGSL